MWGTLGRIHLRLNHLAGQDTLAGFGVIPAEAARKLNLSAPTVTRAVAVLEEQVGTELFVRTTRHLRHTDSGERYLRDCIASQPMILACRATQPCVGRRFCMWCLFGKLGTVIPRGTTRMNAESSVVPDAAVTDRAATYFASEAVFEQLNSAFIAGNSAELREWLEHSWSARQVGCCL